MEVGRMDEWVLVESGMGQLQVAVAGLGEGGLVAGHAGRARAPGTRHLGTWARWHGCSTAKAREEAAAVVTVG